MKRYKKRIVALTLASLVTIAGSFASDNYKNSLTGLRFENTSTGEVKLILQTRTAYSGSIMPVRKDANTYILTLPEVKSEAETPNLQNVYGNIESVNIRTMPYSNSAKGYTRITLKTNQQSLKLLTTNQVFIPSNTKRNTNTNKPNPTTADKSDNSNIRQQIKEEIAEELETYEIESNDEPETSTYKPITVKKIEPDIESTKFESNKSSNNQYIILLSILLAIGCAFFYVRANNKMKELVGFGENQQDKEILPPSLANKIKKTVNKIDKDYPQSATATKINNQFNAMPKNVKKANVESLDIIDLDALFKEQKSKNIQKIEEDEEENSALEDFLSGFSFDEEFGNNEIEIEEKISYDEELFEKIINKENLIFSKEDISCINKLLNNEILDSTFNNIENFVVSNPISVPFSKQKYIEELVLSYTVNQGILFKENDIKILNSLMNVELDNDFITDLRTNNRRTIEMETAILLNDSDLKKPTEIKTLDVKENLPNLSEAIKKQGNKKIISEYKPSAMYFNTNCEVKTLSVGKEVQDLALELYKDDLFKYKPSAKYEIVDNNYTIGDGAIKFNTDKSKQTPKKKEIKQTPVNKNSTEELAQKENEKRIERINQIKNKIVEKPKAKVINCFMDGESMQILSSVELGENKGCYLAKKSDGFLVLGYIKDKLIKIKSYTELKSEKIQARKSEDLPDGTSRFIVRIGINKFVIDLKENEIKYVMDLC